MPSPRDLVATPYRRGVLVLAIITLCWRAWTVSRWTWYIDDWQFLARSESMPLGDYLIQIHHGHVMPAGFLVVKIITATSPLNFTVVIALVALASALSVCLWGLAFERLTSGSLLALLPLAVLALSPISLFPMMWWACSIDALPLQLCLAWIVIACSAWVDHGRRRDLMWLAIAFVVALAFWQKSLLLALPAVVTVFALAPGSLRSRLRTTAAPTGVLLAIALPYLAIFAYLSSRPSEANNTTTTLDGFTLMGTLERYAHGLSDMFLPAVLGGPWGTLQVPEDPYSAPTTMVTFAVLAVCAGLLVWLALRHRQVMWLLALPVAYFMVALGVVLFSSRATNVGDVMSIDRYYMDSVLVAALTAALMIGVARRRTPAAPAARWVVPAAFALLGTSLVVSNVVGVQRMSAHPGRDWINAVRVAGEDYSAERPLVIWDSYPPKVVTLGELWGEDARFSTMLGPLSPEVTTMAASDQVHIIDEAGGVRAVSVGVKARSGVGPDEGCGWLISPDQSVTVDLDGSLFAWDWLVQVNTLAASDAVLMITVGDITRTLRADSGLHQQQFQVRGEVPEQVEVTMIDGTQALCITEVLAGDATY